MITTFSGIARAFPGGRPAHPEPQIEEENEERLRKDERKFRRVRKNWGNVALLPTRGWESGYAPDHIAPTVDNRPFQMRAWSCITPYPLRSLPYLAYDNVNPAMVISMMLRSSMPAFEKVYTDDKITKRD